MTALLPRKGLADEMSRANASLCHRGRGLDGQEFLHEGLVKAAAKLAEGLRQPQVGWRGIDWVLAQPPRLPHGKIGAHAMTEICIRGSQGMLEQCQGP